MVIEDAEDVVIIVVVVIDVLVVVSVPELNNKNGMTAAASVIIVTTNVNILFEISLIISFFLFFSKMIDDCYFDGAIPWMEPFPQFISNSTKMYFHETLLANL